MCNKSITQFYLPPTHKPHLPLLPICKASPPFGWYSLSLPMKKHTAMIVLLSQKCCQFFMS